MAALAQVTEVAGELAQEQCLWLWQGWGGQQGSGSLATLLQYWGLCSRGNTGKKMVREVWEVRDIPMPLMGAQHLPAQGMSCGSSLLRLDPQKI